MAPNEIQFARPGGWRIDSWIPKESKYQYLFAEHGTLLIGMVNNDFHTAAWLDQNGQFHSIHGFIIKGLADSTAARLVVRTELEGLVCAVTLSMDPAAAGSPLTGTIELHDLGAGEGPVGTFTAEANSGEEIMDATRPEERNAV